MYRAGGDCPDAWREEAAWSRARESGRAEEEKVRQGGLARQETWARTGPILGLLPASIGPLLGQPASTSGSYSNVGQFLLYLENNELV